MSVKIHHISDTHGFHNQLTISKDIDIVIHSGDATNYYNPLKNFVELIDFIDWFGKVDVSHKIYVPGNHDAWIYHNLREAKERFNEVGVVLLNKEEIVLNGLKIYGDPTSPSFGNWYFMAKREKIHKHWALIPDDTDILITHSPPKGILDMNGDLQLVGDNSISKRIDELNIKYHLFGHIHTNKKVKNHGILIRDGKTYSNGSCVMDGNFKAGLIHHGNIIKIEL